MEDKTYDLSRFSQAHRRSYQTALTEIKNGRKYSHWMWYIFPQLTGLGKSSTARYYGLKDLEEAKAFLEDPYLGGNLKEISRALLALDTSDPYAVFGGIDGKKLQSCMTLFAHIPGADPVFSKVLNKYYHGHEDRQTCRLLARS